MRLTERIIDLDSVFEEYANKNNQEYIEKPRPPFETRYYFALLNNIKTNNNLIW